MSANAGRDDYSTTIVAKTIPPAEPVFILRGQDQLAEAVVRTWALFASQAGVDTAVIEQALEVADAMSIWHTKKFPDASHLDENDAKQLRFKHGRREQRTLHGLEGPKL